MVFESNSVQNYSYDNQLISTSNVPLHEVASSKNQNTPINKLDSLEKHKNKTTKSFKIDKLKEEKYLSSKYSIKNIVQGRSDSLYKDFD